MAAGAALAAGAAAAMLLPPDAMPELRATPVEISATPVPLSRRDPALRQLGALTYLDGWHLRSLDPRFGGLSSMAVVGNRVLAISDTGLAVRFRLAAGGRIEDAWIAPLPGTDDAASKKTRDSEALALDPATGRTWIAFENDNMIARYDPQRTRVEARAKPRAMRKWPRNAGPEALLRLPDGRFLVFAEDAPRPGGASAALLFASDPAEPGAVATPFSYRAPDGMVPTDAALLGDGRVLVLNRRFSLMDGFSAALTLIDPHAIVRDRIVPSVELARIDPPLTVDNMEALAVTRSGGRTIVWIMSDDNYNMIERTLLMRFVLRPLPPR